MCPGGQNDPQLRTTVVDCRLPRLCVASGQNPHHSQLHREQVRCRVPELLHSRSMPGMILPFSSKAKVHSNISCESKQIEKVQEVLLS